MDSMMKIGYDAKRLFHNKTGLGNYSRSIVQNHRAMFSDDELVLLSSKMQSSSYKSLFSNENYSLVSGNNGVWRMAGMTKDIDRLKLDIFHGLSNELPLNIKKVKGLKKVVTIHDLIFLKFPHYYPLFDRLIYREKFKRACVEADKIIAVSNATKNDIIDYFHIDPNKIEVIYQSCNPTFFDLTDVEKTKDSKPIDERPYGLFVSSISERKNLSNIFHALHQISGERPLLYVVGEGKKHKIKMQNVVEKLDLTRDVKFLGHVSDLKLKELYYYANFSIYPSFYEGFGIPILESLFCGTPVITSNLSSMPEAANGLGELVDPNSQLEIKEAILKFSGEKEVIRKEDIENLKHKFDPHLQSQQIRSTYSKLLLK